MGYKVSCKGVVIMAVVALMIAFDASAQEWHMPWICRHGADSVEQVWFRGAVYMRSMPAKASIHIASEGRYIVFVNGYNVTTDVMEPARPNEVREYDARRFLHEGTNIVAVWYSPRPPCVPTHRQVALTLSGTTAEGAPFAMATDGGWLCRKANGTTEANGDETIDANDYVDGWNTADGGIVGWECAKTAQPGWVATGGKWYEAQHMAKIQAYASFDNYGQSVAYNFANRFSGWVRLTMRDMQQGDTVRVNGLTYICSGEPDEQACRRFTSSAATMAVVSGTGSFRRNNITNVEAISIEPYLHKGYRY